MDVVKFFTLEKMFKLFIVDDKFIENLESLESYTPN